MNDPDITGLAILAILALAALAAFFWLQERIARSRYERLYRSSRDEAGRLLEEVLSLRMAGIEKAKKEFNGQDRRKSNYDPFGAGPKRRSTDWPRVNPTLQTEEELAKIHTPAVVAAILNTRRHLSPGPYDVSEMNNGLHMRIRNPRTKRSADFWPSTGRWIQSPGPNTPKGNKAHSGRYLNSLRTYLGE